MGRLAAARLLHEAHELLLETGSTASVRAGWRRLAAELACPTGPQPAASEADRALARRMELTVVPA